ncbi:hypothetical protein F4781DRAFT_67023 [Annulohypoxylon bovei var. microspora]|nr:hypothetical protein F4781DRAFT_67023 [Annulohypoxylon bovei var. microspora]
MLVIQLITLSEREKNQIIFKMSFNDLPFELRSIVWEYALPDDTQEVCIPWPLPEETPQRQFENRPIKFLEPFLVDTAFPVLMHVCHESRESAISRTRFRYSPVAGCPVPFRDFRPELDIMYHSTYRPPTTTPGVKFGVFAWNLKHLALDLHTLRNGTYFWTAFSHYYYLRTITCILPASGSIVETAARFRPPVRRCRLRPVEQPSDGSSSHFINVDDGHCRRMTSMPQFLEEIRDHIDSDFAGLTEDDGMMHQDFADRWDVREQKFDFELLAQSFEEYRGGQWVSSSKHAVRFDKQYIRSPAAQAAVERIKSYKASEAENWTPLRNPETFRVNDIQQDEVKFEIH